MLLRLTAPPGGLEATIQAARLIMLPVRLLGGPAACAHLSVDVNDRNTLCYVEEWPDIEGIEEQIRSPRFGRVLALMETSAAPPTIEFRFVSSTRELDYIAEVRSELPAATQGATGRTRRLRSHSSPRRRSC